MHPYSNYKEAETKLKDMKFARLKDAQETLDTLLSMIESYGFVSLGDVYDLFGVTSQFDDMKFGWIDLSKTAICTILNVMDETRVYTLSFPPVISLDAETKKDKGMKEIDIRLLQYANLRFAFDKLKDYALGENYYNMSNDVYSIDAEACLDIMLVIWKKRHPIKALFGIMPDFLTDWAR